MNQDEKLWSGLSYLGLMICAIPTIVILLMKKDESNVIKFHALQALALVLAALVLSIALQIVSALVAAVLGPLALLITLLSVLVSLALTGYWIFLIIKTFMGDDVEIPVIGPFIRANLIQG